MSKTMPELGLPISSHNQCQNMLHCLAGSAKTLNAKKLNLR
jgi:hypothetical protein